MKCRNAKFGRDGIFLSLNLERGLSGLSNECLGVVSFNKNFFDYLTTIVAVGVP
jgi:hypothetical protein